MTKLDRIKMYEKALEDFRQDKEFTRLSLCFYFNLEFGIHVMQVMSLLPELSKQEPKNRGPIYWWPLSYKEQRIQALNQALQLAKR